MDNTIQLFWNGPVWNILNTPWEITGYSRASYRTGFYIKHLDLMIDAGPQKTGNPKTILITHCHGDHIANLPFTLIENNDNKNKKMTNIYVPEKSKNRLYNYVNSMFSANYSCDFKGKIANFNSIKGGDIFDITTNNTNIRIEVFTCTHDIPTVAYGISTKKQHLKEEYYHLKGDSKALVELKKNNIDITNTIYEPNIAFVWDTSIIFFKNNIEIFKYKVIMVECTFIYEDEYELSLEKKHIHWKSLKPIVLDNPNILFVLVHFSLRYTEYDIDKFFKEENINNIKPWLQLKKS